MASYDWIDLEDPEDYDRLIDVLDPEFDPKTIAQSLKSQVSDAAKGVLVEHGYVDKDYRSTFYNFYAKKGRHYRTDCVRLHFFDGTVGYNDDRLDITCNDLRPQDHYFGYIVLRPTIVATLGRSVLSPNIRRGARGLAIQSVHYVNLLGRRLPVWGFPSMAQHVDIAVCAHVSCWAILRYYSETFPQHREYLVHDITKLVAPFDPGGLVPSLGFNVLGAERVFQAAGCFPVLVGKGNSSSDEAFFSQLLAYLESGFPLFVAMTTKDPGGLVPSLGFNVLGAERVFQAAGCFPVLVGKGNSSSDEAFFSQLLAYLESGFPLFVAMTTEKHAVVTVGYSWRKSAAPTGTCSSHVWAQVETLLAVDDNLLPYSTVALRPSGNLAASPSYTADAFKAFIVALPDKIYYPADAIETFSRRVERWLARTRGPESEPLELRRYFITTISRLREHARKNHTHLGDALLGLMMHLDTAQYVWVIEYCSVGQWNDGLVAARAIVDATASPTDEVPIWLLHDEEVAHVFDRSAAEMHVTSIHLDRTGLGPLPRIELNLRPVVESPASTSTSGGARTPGGEE